MKKAGRLRVLFLHSGSENPYIELLSAALRASGVAVSVAPHYRHLHFWRAVLRTGRPDIIHIQWHHGYFVARNLPFSCLNTLFFFAQWATLRLAGVRFVWTVHELINHQMLQARWELTASKLLARAVDAIVTHSRSSADVVAHACGLPADRIHVAPHGNYIGRYPDVVRERAAARERLRLDPHSRLFLFFGAVRRHKGITRLLRAFRSLGDDGARLVVAGEPESPELAAELEALGGADTRVTLRLEYLDDAELADYLAACDYVVLPHLSVLTSGSAILAASHARAPVMPRLGCMREFPDETAVLFDPDTAGGLLAALERALRASPSEMGAAARAYIERYTWHVSAAATIAVYNAVLGRS